MESLAAAAFPGGEFDSFNGMFAIDDHQLDFTQQYQLHNLFSFPLEDDEGSFKFINTSSFCPNPEPNMSSADGFVFNESNHIVDWFPPTFPSVVMEDGTVTVVENDQIDHSNISSENTRKRTRVSKMLAPKKNSKINVNGDGGESSIGSDGISCSTTSSLEDDNVSKDTKNGKKRASRGLATDPQSLYARRRREKINERLKILQNLVPNGTKVDISTMLEEAVQYVKFLQLQIKLLSSDDLWMYAPIAYNGIDIDLDKKISKVLQMNPGKVAIP